MDEPVRSHDSWSTYKKQKYVGTPEQVNRHSRLDGPVIMGMTNDERNTAQ
jgi:hypothetical protein